MSAAAPLVFILAGEESGDLLGASLMRALSDRLGGRVRFQGVGGRRMTALGLASMFPMEEVSLHGITEVLFRGGRLLRRIRETSSAVIAARPDVLLLVDCPGFNLRVGKIVGDRAPAIPIVDYVSPSVWAYFPGRAAKMARYVDQLLAILPFEPAVHQRLGGPPTTYVGHPLMERLTKLRPLEGERAPLGHGRKPVLVVLPGSRRSEIGRLMGRFGATVARVVEQFGPVEVVLPTVPRHATEIRERAALWRFPPTIVEGEVAAYAAFRRAHAALAASGTVTLELALSAVPMTVAYRVDPVLRLFKSFLRAHSIVLPNLILGDNSIPEYLDGEANPATLAAALVPLLSDTPERRAQLAAFDRLDALMALPEGTPSGRAAEIVLEAMRQTPEPLAG
ncbi:MAG TPA: lipid-A-disaccharide synthase [Bauldia sp.]|nr:lipid-A-disaccharide synthase [Bauldia sp.]